MNQWITAIYSNDENNSVVAKLVYEPRIWEWQFAIGWFQSRDRCGIYKQNKKKKEKKKLKERKKKGRHFSSTHFSCLLTVDLIVPRSSCASLLFFNTLDLSPFQRVICCSSLPSNVIICLFRANQFQVSTPDRSTVS